MNIFRPFERKSEDHEDRMTRAALLVLRMVPMALEAFLEIARSNLAAEDRLSSVQLGGLASLGSPIRVATQDSKVHRPVSEDRRDRTSQVEVLLSVYLTPDDSVEFDHEEIQPSPRGQRLDGVIEFDQSLIIAIESKVVEGMPPGQSEYINLDGVEATEKPVIHVSWQSLFEAWVRISEEGLLGKAERELIDDLFLFAEDQPRFDRLLPFTTLGRCGSSDPRIKRRLRAVLDQATGFVDQTTWSHGWNFIVPGGSTFSEVGLHIEGDELRLTIWPGQKADQSRALLGRPEELRAVERSSSPAAAENGDPSGWRSGVSLHAGYYRFHWDVAPAKGSTLATYADNAVALRLMVGESERSEFDSQVREPLVAMNLAASLSDPAFERAMKSAKPVFRAACWISRTWKFDLAVRLDEGDELVDSVAGAASELFGALGEDVPERMVRHHSNLESAPEEE